MQYWLACWCRRNRSTRPPDAFRMHTNGPKKGFEWVLDYLDGDEAGIKSVIQVEGEKRMDVKSWLPVCEVHLWCRGRRLLHLRRYARVKWWSEVEINPEDLRIDTIVLVAQEVSMLIKLNRWITTCYRC